MISLKKNTTPIKRILLTPGEPAGVGPDIITMICQKDWAAELIVIADPNLLLERAAKLNIPLSLIEFDSTKPASLHKKGSLKIIPVDLITEVIPGVLNAANAAYVMNTLRQAAELCLKKIAQAIVTGPVQKSIINQAGIPFNGHTEFFAEFCHVPQTVMLFVVNQLKVALATTHLPLAKVSEAITYEHLQNTIIILIEGLRNYFKMVSPRINVCGLNPHAGEGGYLGREEMDLIIPLLAKLREENYHVQGPFSADTIFTPKYLDNCDATLAMYHDQALPLVKYLGFGNAVNMTLGLPFIRTSVDHGTALDVAGTGLADPGSLEAALTLAIDLAR